MPTLSGRIKLSLFGAVTVWIFARTVFAMSLPIHAAPQPVAAPLSALMTGMTR